MHEQLESIKLQAEQAREIMTQVSQDAQEAMDALEVVKQDADEVEGELEEHISNLAGLQATMERADSVRDEGEAHGISI